jgi:hypothetical protein
MAAYLLLTAITKRGLRGPLFVPKLCSAIRFGLLAGRAVLGLDRVDLRLG